MCTKSPVANIGLGVVTGGLSTVAGAGIAASKGDMKGALTGGIFSGKTPGAPNLGQFPGLTPQEQAIIDKMGISLDQFNQLIQGSSTALAQNKNVLQQISGLYDAQGNLDQGALADLKARTQGQLVQAQGVGSAALGYLQNYFGAGGGGTGSSGTPGGSGVAQTQADVYKAALEGTGAINAATTQQQARDFQTLKDSLAQRGIMVTGDSPAQATSDSTAGQRAIELFKNNVAAQNSQERLGYISTLGGQVAGTAGLAGQSATAGMAATNAQLGFSQQAGTMGLSTLAPYLQQYNQGLSMMYQPYQQQQLGPYQQNMAQAQANYQAGLQQYQAGQSMLGGIGSIVGTGVGAYFGGPWGAAMGSQVGKTAGGSGAMTAQPYSYGPFTGAQNA